ncbi:hypothetical protein BSQ37_00010 [Pediococcus damnosus]|nr:hypothetical protein BSQ37_00010 [Pediococcus damnosus]
MVNTILKEADLFCPNSVRINFTIYHSKTRSGTFAPKLYQNFTGILQCDGYAGYNLLANSVTRVGC